LIYQTPNQIPTPCTIAIGNIIAPAIRKPHLSSEKQTNKCVNHAATDIAINTGANRESLISILLFVFFYSNNIELTIPTPKAGKSAQLLVFSQKLKILILYL
jgi:hypothetical protein